MYNLEILKRVFEFLLTVIRFILLFCLINYLLMYVKLDILQRCKKS